MASKAENPKVPQLCCGPPHWRALEAQGRRSDPPALNSDSVWGRV